MSKLVKLFAAMALIVGAIAIMPDSAAARGRGGGAHFGGMGHARSFGGGAHFGGRHFGGGHFGGVHLGGGHFRRGYYGGGYGGWGGFGLGSAIVLGLASPYYYDYGPDYYAPSNCGWVRVLRSHRHSRVWRRAWRCW